MSHTKRQIIAFFKFTLHTNQNKDDEIIQKNPTPKEEEEVGAAAEATTATAAAAEKSTDVKSFINEKERINTWPLEHSFGAEYVCGA